MSELDLATVLDGGGPGVLLAYVLWKLAQAASKANGALEKIGAAQKESAAAQAEIAKAATKQAELMREWAAESRRQHEQMERIASEQLRQLERQADALRAVPGIVANEPTAPILMPHTSNEASK